MMIDVKRVFNPTDKIVQGNFHTWSKSLKIFDVFIKSERQLWEDKKKHN